jgi:membrane protease subunit HflC
VLIQETLDSYDSGVRIVRLNLDRADPPEQVIDAFREVQAAEQERDRLERQADAYANRVLAGARGEAAQLLEEAEAYRAQVVNEAQGEASRFLAVLTEYEQAPEVTRRRLYLETMERVLGDVDLVILDGEGGSGGSGVVPYLPLNELRRGTGTGTHDDRELELMRRITFLIPALVLAIAVLLSSIFVVDERKGAGAAIRSDPPGDRRAGAELQDPVHPGGRLYDDRILSLDTAAIEVTPSDDRRLVVDAFARYRIVDVVQFRQAVGVGGLRTGEDRLERIINPQIREVLGADGVTSNTILSDERAVADAAHHALARAEARALGLEVLDVRLKQTNLPVQNLEATFARMRAEREREATDEIARGNEAAQRVRAQADRTVVELVSEAQREAEITRGEADAERNRIFAEAFGQDPEFFEFYRSMTAYERALRQQNSTMVISPDSEFFEFLDGTGLPSATANN